MSVQSAQREISSVEFLEWIAFERTNPSGEERADIRNALLCYVVASVVGGKGHKLEDFIIDFDKKEDPTLNPLEVKLKAFIAKHNAKEKIKENIEKQELLK